MADADDVRRLALALPNVVEIDSEGFDFRVAGKGFVWSYPERMPGRSRVIRTDVAVLFVGDEAEKQALLLGEPEVFFTTTGYDGVPLVLLRLAEVHLERLAELVTDAWRMRGSSDLVDERVGPGSGRPDASPRLPGPMELEFSGEMWFWKGPAPHHFITVPEAECSALKAASASVTYGWGMIPVAARIGETGWTTSLFPKEGRYIVPVKAAVQAAEGLEVGDTVTVRLVVEARPVREPAARSERR